MGQGPRGYLLALDAIAGRRAVDRWLTRCDETPEIGRLRRRIDALDRRIVVLLSDRAELARGNELEPQSGRPKSRESASSQDDRHRRAGGAE